MIMESGCHWLTALAEVYARHAARHGPHQLLPAAVLPAHGRVPGHGGASPPGASPDGRMAVPSTPNSAHDTRFEPGQNGHGAIDRDRLRAEMSHL
jgi:hypothetical protein